MCRHIELVLTRAQDAGEARPDIALHLMLDAYLGRAGDPWISFGPAGLPQFRAGSGPYVGCEDVEGPALQAPALPEQLNIDRCCSGHSDQVASRHRRSELLVGHQAPAQADSDSLEEVGR